MICRTIIFVTLVSIVSAIPGLLDLTQGLIDRQYPEIKAPFRVEVEVLRMDNPRQTTKGWMPCDFFSGTCDPKITGA